MMTQGGRGPEVVIGRLAWHPSLLSSSPGSGLPDIQKEEAREGEASAAPAYSFAGPLVRSKRSNRQTCGAGSGLIGGRLESRVPRPGTLHFYHPTCAKKGCRRRRNWMGGSAVPAPLTSVP